MVVAGGAAAPWLVPSPAEHSTVIVLACAAAVVLGATVALWVHRAPRLLVATTVLVSGVTALGAHNIAADGLSARQLNLRDGALLVSHVLLALGMLVATRRRLRADSRAVISDGLIIGLGAWIVLWVLLLQPALHGVTGLPAATLMRGATLAVLSVILFLVATLLFSDTAPTVSVIFATLAVVTLLTGEIVYLVDARPDASLVARVLGAPFVVAAACATGMLLHPSVRSLLSPARRRPTPPLMTRLVSTTASLVAPVVMLTLTDPASRNDRIVRVVSIVVLSAVVMARVVQSVRANARTQADLEHNAQTDPLTNLPNRTAMLELVTEATQLAHGTPRQPTVLFIDVDRFKNINDSLGHSAGDDVLLEVARRLVAAVPAHASVGRISGDEFVILDPHTETATQAVVLAEHVLDSLREPLGLRQGDMFVSVSIGVAMAVRSLDLTADEILRHADTAMYRAKDAGRNCIAFFDDSMVEKVTHRLDIETALYRALDKNELRLVHQPIVDTSLGLVVGFEALMRWDRGVNGTVSPAEFIPIAEETGTIVPLGSWALLDALTQLRLWIDAGACTSHTTISVNVSARQLHDPTFVSVVTEALSRSGVSADQLWLEVTESLMITEPTQALTALKQLNAIGVRIAIDDFGTGYSSLSLLQRFPIQRIKIDRAFVHALTTDGGSHSLVRTIVAMADSLGADIVAEGVETMEQLDILAGLDCRKAQGYLISHPVDSAAVPDTVLALEGSPRWRR
ncbi:MAG: EAL domain-containing protein [Actinobacteria bacterium]|nr:EAL domain-containing protein [Actinomycetota bacterium]